MNTAYNMDCMEAMKAMPDKFFDLAVVDPPYGLGKKLLRGGNTGVAKFKDQYAENEWDDERPPKEYFDQLFRVSKNQVIWGANYFIDYLRPSRGIIAWDKNLGEPLNFSHWEMAWTSFDCIARKVTIRSNTGDRIHPTQKPVALYRWIFQHYARPGDKILDTHLGSGSSRIAAHEAGLDFMGFEIDPDYFAGALERYEAAEAQMSMFVQTAEREPPFEEIARAWAVTRGVAFGRGYTAGAKRLIGGGRGWPLPMNLFTPIHYLICACACIFSGLVRAGFRRKGENHGKDRVVHPGVQVCKRGLCQDEVPGHQGRRDQNWVPSLPAGTSAGRKERHGGKA